MKTVARQEFIEGKTLASVNISNYIKITQPCKALFFLILGLQIFFFKILRSEEGKKIKIKITKKILFI